MKLKYILLLSTPMFLCLSSDQEETKTCCCSRILNKLFLKQTSTPESRPESPVGPVTLRSKNSYAQKIPLDDGAATEQAGSEKITPTSIYGHQSYGTLSASSLPSAAIRHITNSTGSPLVSSPHTTPIKKPSSQPIPVPMDPDSIEKRPVGDEHGIKDFANFMSDVID